MMLLVFSQTLLFGSGVQMSQTNLSLLPWVVLGRFGVSSQKQRQAGILLPGGRNVEAKQRVLSWGSEPFLGHAAVEISLLAPPSPRGSPPLCSNPSMGRTSAWWPSRGWTSHPRLVPSGSWAPASLGTTTPNSTGATTASALPRPADVRGGGAGERDGGTSLEAKVPPRRNDLKCEREQHFLTAQTPPLFTEGTAKPCLLPLQNPRSASRESLLQGRTEP